MMDDLARKPRAPGEGDEPAIFAIPRWTA